MRTRALIAILLITVSAAAQRRRPSTPAPTDLVPQLDPRCDQTATAPPSLPLCNPAKGWSFIDSGEFRIWWQDRCPEDAREAATVAKEVVATKLYERVKDLIGEPLRDGTWLCNGGSAHYDVYLNQRDDREPVSRYDESGCQQRITYMHIGAGHHVTWAVGHELVHAAEYAYQWNRAFDCLNMIPQGSVDETMHFLSEATANALELRLYPTPCGGGEAARHQATAEAYFKTAAEPLDDYNSRQTTYGYSAYLFMLFLTDELYPQVMKSIWGQAKADTMIDAIEQGMRGDSPVDRFKDLWPKFATLAVNEAPWDRYRHSQWDCVESKVPFKDGETEKTLDLAGRQDAEVTFDAKEMKRLSARYFKLKIKPEVRTLTFVNPFVDSKYERINVQALLKFDSDPAHNRAEDWTGKDRVSICLDKKSDRATEIILVVSNSTWEHDAEALTTKDSIRFVGTNVGCWRWKATTTATRNGSMQLITTTGGSVATNSQVTASAEIIFERGALNLPTPVGFPKSLETYVPLEGTCWWNAAISVIAPRGCTGGTDAGRADAKASGGALIIANVLPGEPAYRYYSGWGAIEQLTGICGGTKVNIAWWEPKPTPDFVVSPEGKIEGRSSSDKNTSSSTYHVDTGWLLVPLREE
jgi:hypothetical protein